MTDLPVVEPFEVEVCFDVTHQFNADEQITAIGGSASILFLGTNCGHVIHLRKDNDTFTILGKFQLPNKQEIRQIDFASAIGILLVLSDKVLFDIVIDSFQFLGFKKVGNLISVDCKRRILLTSCLLIGDFSLDVLVKALVKLIDDCQKVVSSRSSIQCYTVNSNPVVDDPFCLQIAVATTSKQLHICERRNGKMESLQKLNTDGIVSAMSFARFTVCFASSGTYCIYNISTKSVISLFPFDPLAIRPQVCSADMEFIMNGMDGLLISVTEQGVSTRPPMLFPSLAIEAIVCSFPYVYLRTKEEIAIISLEDWRITQALRTPQAEVLCSLDGLVFISSHQILYHVHMITLNRQADALFACGKFNDAISLYEKKLHKHFDVECLSDFVALKKKIAFKYIAEREFAKVIELLISAEVSPEEVVSLLERQTTGNFWRNDVEWSDSHQFLMDYLQQIRNLPMFARYRTVVDSFLVKLFIVQGNPKAVYNLHNYYPNYPHCAEFLMSYGYYHGAAKMWLTAGDNGKAWEIWKHLSCGDFKDAAFKVEELAAHVPSIMDTKLLIDVLSWLIPLVPQQCIEVILGTSLLDLKTIKEILGGDAKLLRLYLENIPVTEEVAKDLCNIYINDMAFGDMSCRHRLRHLLLKINASDRIFIYDRLPSECGVERLLCDSSTITIQSNVAYVPANSPLSELKPFFFYVPSTGGRAAVLFSAEQPAADILDKIILTYHDYDAAELICSHYSPTQPDVCLHLLKFLENSAVDDAESRMCALLKCMGDTIDSKKIITSLPEFAAFDQVATYMKRAVAKKQEERHVLQSKACLLQRRIEREKPNLPNEKIVIEDKAICMVCKEEISSTDVLTCLKTGYVIHSKCLKYENLCPLTNAILMPPE